MATITNIAFYRNNTKMFTFNNSLKFEYCFRIYPWCNLIFLIF